MCLVSYIPLSEGYILSSNRDEFLDRNAKEVVNEKIGSTTLYYPQDTQGGSWIIASDKRVHVVVLNGAFENHKRKLPYRKSRGVMMKEFFEYENVIDFFEQYDYVGIEPFTMIIASDQYLYEFRWDGYLKHVKDLAMEETHIWSSCTLYNQELSERREVLLRKELDLLTATSLDDFAIAHQYVDPEDERLGLKVKLLDSLMTISHTQIRVDKEVILVHRNILSGENKQLKI